MSFDQWTLKESTSSNSLFRLDVPSINDTSSLIFGNTTGTTNRVRTAYVSTASGLQRGLTRGRIFTIVKALETPNSLNSFGLFCMASSLESHSTGVHYRLQVTGGTTNNLKAFESTTGGFGFTVNQGTQLGASQDVTWNTIGNTLSLGLEWDSTNQGFHGGTQLKIYAGTATDFSDLALVLTVVDTTSPLVASVAEGIFIVQDSGLVHRVQVDDTSILVASA